MHGAIPPVPNTLSWFGAQLKKARVQLYLYHRELGINEVNWIKLALGRV